MAQTKKCQHCGKEFQTRESNDQWTEKIAPKFARHRKYCSDACKQAAYRARALHRNKRNAKAEAARNQRLGIMPHLEEWARRHGLI